MKKTLLAAICATAIGVTPFAAMAQATSPSGQDSKMSGGSMQKSDGASQGMSKNSMKKDATKDGADKNSMKKDNNMMMKKN